MAGAALFAAAVVTMLVLGTYLVQTALIALQIGWVLLAFTMEAAGLVACAVGWCLWFCIQPSRAMASLRDAIAAAEAESAIRRLNAAR